LQTSSEATHSIAMSTSGLGTISDQVRSYWDMDAATYDRSPGHHPRTALEMAAWAGELRRLLPPPPATVLDVGAGTGFLALLLARHGYAVTALDLSAEMLGRLKAKADDAGLEVNTVHGNANDTPREGFDAVVERHLLWTLPEPEDTLEAWHLSAPTGRLLLVESVWGEAGGRAEQLRRAGHEAMRRLRHGEHSHHAEYSAELRAHFPLAGGGTPDQLVQLVESTSWAAARVERLRDVEWAARQALPSLIDRLIGVAPHFAVVAGQG
jgi:ubiquinone/menaquinone biosynthesis C-methylase UbiE